MSHATFRTYLYSTSICSLSGIQMQLGILCFTRKPWGTVNCPNLLALCPDPSCPPAPKGGNVLSSTSHRWRRRTGRLPNPDTQGSGEGPGTLPKGPGLGGRPGSQVAESGWLCSMPV